MSYHLSGMGATVDWSTCASTRPDPDDPQHFQDCLDANGNVIDSRQFTNPPGSTSDGTILGLTQNQLLLGGVAVAAFILFGKKKGRR